MNKEEQFKNMTTFFKGNYSNTLDYFISTEGCYVISTELGIALAYRTSVNNPKEIDLNGEDLFIQYLTGDIVEFIDFCSDNIKNLIFERNGKLKVHNLQCIKNKIIINKG